MVSGMDAMFSCIFNLCDSICAHMRMRMYGAQGLLQGSSLKKSVSGGSFIRGKSVKEEFNSLRLGPKYKYQSFICISTFIT